MQPINAASRLRTQTELNAATIEEAIKFVTDTAKANGLKVSNKNYSGGDGFSLSLDLGQANADIYFHLYDSETLEVELYCSDIQEEISGILDDTVENINEGERVGELSDVIGFAKVSIGDTRKAAKDYAKAMVKINAYLADNEKFFAALGNTLKEVKAKTKFTKSTVKTRKKK